MKLQKGGMIHVISPEQAVKVEEAIARGERTIMLDGCLCFLPTNWESEAADEKQEGRGNMTRG